MSTVGLGEFLGLGQSSKRRATNHRPAVVDHHESPKVDCISHLVLR